MRRGAKPTKAKVEAKPPIVRKSSKSKGSRVQDLEERLAEAVERESEARKRESEALEQQTATSEILRVISSSPTDLQPVLNAVVKSAARFCGAADAELFRLDGEHLKVAAHSGPIAAPVGRLIPVVKGSVSGRAFAERRAIHVADLQAEAEEFPVTSGMARELGFRTSLSVPLLREGIAVGTITLRRAEVNPFTDKQIALLQTFADQAVIAIENVRLFHEMKEALEQQTATSEILRIISSSPTDLQPVFNTIVRSADRLCNGLNSAVYLYDGELVHHVALSDPSPEARVEFARQFPQRPNPELGVGRVVLTGTIAHSADVLGDPNFGEGARRFARLRGFRALLLVPMLRAGRVVGVISVGRAEPGLFPDSQVTLLQTFADQAVIAIENGRLFTELQEKNRALTQAHAQVTETLEQQTATSEILRTIAHSQTDVQPVFETIVRNAAQLCQATSSLLWLLEGDRLRIVAPDNLPRNSPTELAVANAPNLSRTIRDGTIHNIGDTENDPRITGEAFRLARLMGARAVLTVPMRRDREGIGALTVYRRSPGVFTDGQVELLKTFTDQAVIAIENVHLFKELEARNRDLTEALEQQTATAEILRVISSSPTDLRPVLDTIAENAARVCNARDAVLFRLEGDTLRIAAQYGTIPSRGAEQHLSVHRGWVTGRAVVDRRTIHVEDLAAVSETEFPQGREIQQRFGHRTTLATPLLREGVALGAILIRRMEVQPFTDKQIKLIETFADQAVIAIENVRLFNELQASNRELTTALDQQTATSDILRVISRSQTNVQPVFDAIVASAVRLLGGYTGALTRIAGDQIAIAATTGHDAASEVAVRAAFPASLQSEVPHAQAIRDRVPLNIADYQTDPRLPEALRASAAIRGYRSVVVVPMLLHDEAIGAIGVTRRDPGGFTDDEIALLKTFADQAVIAIENVRLFNDLEGKNVALTAAHAQVTEALEQQTATAEILRVISSSPTDVQPVFDAIVESAVRLCDARYGAVFNFDGDLVHLMAHHNFSETALEGFREQYPMRPTRAHISGRAILSGSVVQIPDVTLDPEYGSPHTVPQGFRSLLAVPILRGGAPIGAIVIYRPESGMLSDEQISLLQTFAAQAVIAIENVRLFTELQASNRDLTSALDQQTATSDILRVISRSQTNVQPVFDAIVASAVRLLEGYSGGLTRVVSDQLELAALTSTDAAGDASLRALFPSLLSSEGPQQQTIRDRAPLNMADAHTDPRMPEAGRASARIRGVRSFVVVPMLLHDQAIGAIGVTRREAGGFTDDEIALLKTFADQAVIAIENARLLSELQQKNEALTQAHAQVSEALEQQTATAEILRVISRSQTDVQPVFDTIVRSAVRLCDALFSALFQFDGELIHLVAQHNYAPEALEEVRRIYPARPTRALLTGRAILERALVHVPDIELDPEWPHQALTRAVGFRSGLWVPMLREGVPIGVIAVARADPGPFSDSAIELLKTFADQAVIAVENVRLFKELQARTGELTQSVEQLTALGEVSRAVSSTLDVETVLDTIVSRASQLAGAAGCSIFEYDAAAEQFELRATHNADTAFVEALRAVPLRKGEGLMGRAAEMREPIQIPDITQPGAYQSSVRDTLIRFGYRALLAVPLLREGQIIGSLSFNRKAPGEFPPEVVDVLKTFATQSALAIQNARLFREIADKSAQLEAASRHKSEFLANMSHELRTPLNAIIGFSEVLTERMFGELNEKQDEYLKDIYASGQHLLSLINDILDLSKIEAGRMELEATDFDLPSAIDNALILVRERATRRGITLGHSVDERLGSIRSDERKVKQVLLNLLSNALKFTPEGGRIDVSARVHDGVAEVSVTDTGVGIAPEDQEAVFEEFRQVGTADKKVEGTGLGLALSRKFIELHGGRIWVKSQVGHGSTFTFTLPVRLRNEPIPLQ